MDDEAVNSSETIDDMDTTYDKLSRPISFILEGEGGLNTMGHDQSTIALNDGNRSATEMTCGADTVYGRLNLSLSAGNDRDGNTTEKSPKITDECSET